MNTKLIFAVLCGICCARSAAAQSSILVRDTGANELSAPLAPPGITPPPPLQGDAASFAPLNESTGLPALEPATSTATDSTEPPPSILATGQPEKLSSTSVDREREIDTGVRKSVCQIALQTSIDVPKHIAVGAVVPVRIEVANNAEFESKAARVYVAVPPTVQLISAMPTPLSYTAERVEFEVSRIPAHGSVQLELEVSPTTIAKLGFKVVTVPVFEQTIEVDVAGQSLSAFPVAPHVAAPRTEFAQGVSLENTSGTDITNVVVTAEVPAGINIARLNRDAEIDLESRIVTWRIGRIAANSREVCQFVALAESCGEHVTRVTIDSDGSATQGLRLATQITDAAVGIAR